jgi:hypothetical protein
VEGHEQEERLARVAPPQETHRLVCHPVGGVQHLLLVPGSGDVRIAVQAVREVIGIAAGAFAQPGDVIIGGLVVGVPAADVVDESVVQEHVLKAHLGALGVDMHLADRLGLVAMAGKLTCQGDRVIPGDAVQIADPPMRGLPQAGEQARTGRDAGGRGGVSLGETRSAPGPVDPGKAYGRRDARRC